MSPSAPDLERLSTPVAWLDAEGRVHRCQFRLRQLAGRERRAGCRAWRLAELDLESGRLAEVLAPCPRVASALALHPRAPAYPAATSASRSCGCPRSRAVARYWKCMPTREFPGEDPAV
jgi:two-component system nitrogen regulation sensor histidine kinase GlnL